jgi:hypothetical protein
VLVVVVMEVVMEAVLVGLVEVMAVNLLELNLELRLAFVLMRYSY